MRGSIVVTLFRLSVVAFNREIVASEFESLDYSQIRNLESFAELLFSTDNRQRQLGCIQIDRQFGSRFWL